MSKKPWKAAYWPAIIQEIRNTNNARIKNNKNAPLLAFPYAYDSTRYILTKFPKLVSKSRHGNRGFYISTKEMMEAILGEWDSLPLYMQQNLKRNMKSHENMFIHQAVYHKRKEEFNALVAETNS
jgi:hypothetical protein